MKLHQAFKYCKNLRKSSRAAGILAVLAMVSIAPAPEKQAAAAPAPLQLYVHHGKKQCGTFFMGDEFRVCDPAAGWVRAADGKCPSGYADIQKNIPRINCQETGWRPMTWRHLPPGGEQPQGHSPEQAPGGHPSKKMEKPQPSQQQPASGPPAGENSRGFGCAAAAAGFNAPRK